MPESLFFISLGLYLELFEINFPLWFIVKNLDIISPCLHGRKITAYLLSSTLFDNLVSMWNFLIFHYIVSCNILIDPF